MNEQDQRRLAELEAANAQAARSAAELQRDTIAGVAVNESIHRAAAETSATDARMRANRAESNERSMATSAGLARQDATMERAAASNATFAATMITVLGVTIAVALVVYFAWWQPAHRTDVSTNTLIRTDKTIEKTSAPQTVVVKPDNVNVRVTVPESKPKPAESPKPDETPPAESQPAPDKTDPPSTDGDKAPESKNAPDNP